MSDAERLTILSEEVARLCSEVNHLNYQNNVNYGQLPARCFKFTFTDD